MQAWKADVTTNMKMMMMMMMSIILKIHFSFNDNYEVQVVSRDIRKVFDKGCHD